MALLPDWNINDIKELIKKGCTIEAEEKIMELRRTLLSLKEENISLSEENKKLRTQKDISDKIVWRQPSYYLRDKESKREEGPYCQVCYDNDGKLIRLQSIGNNLALKMAPSHICLKCKSTYRI